MRVRGSLRAVLPQADPQPLRNGRSLERASWLPGQGAWLTQALSARLCFAFHGVSPHRTIRRPSSLAQVIHLPM
jgi:hypothetical protein